jgi:hypothetical protein
MYHFCTYFDQHYLPRGLALYSSLRKHCQSFRLWVLCMDPTCYTALSQMSLSGLNPIRLADFEKEDEALTEAKKNRNKIEYYFTCTPSLPLYLFRHHPEISMITYLDADLFFFDSPSPLIDEIADHSIAIIGHRYARRLQRRSRYGTYNVGWISFRRDKNGLTCLTWWREKCLDWCYDRFENGRFADQKYLDAWPGLFQNLIVLQHKGANLAPWNVGNYLVRYCDTKIWVDEQSLIFFHFHGLRQLTPWLYDPNFAGSRAKLGKVTRQHIFAPYINTISEVRRLYLPPGSEDTLSTGKRIDLKTTGANQRIWNMLDRAACALLSVINRNYLFVRNGHVL